MADVQQSKTKKAETHAEVAAKMFSETQADLIIRRDGVLAHEAQAEVRLTVDRKVRETVRDLGGDPHPVYVPDRTEVLGLSNEDLRALRRELDLEALRRSMRAQRNACVPQGIAERDPQPLIEAIRSRKDELTKTLEAHSGEWSYFDPIYRFYHQSFKIYQLQEATVAICDLLQSLLPGQDLNPLFQRVVATGTGHVFEMAHNDDWLEHTLPITTAFFHARFFLEAAVRCARLERVDGLLDSDLAALLYLYNLR
jgi:hypothetical protein